jgi:hypothetical protein
MVNQVKLKTEKLETTILGPPQRQLPLLLVELSQGGVSSVKSVNIQWTPKGHNVKDAPTTSAKTHFATRCNPHATELSSRKNGLKTRLTSASFKIRT